MRNHPLSPLKVVTILGIALLAFGALPLLSSGQSARDPAPAAAAFSGYVYDSSGERGDVPIAGVELGLYGSNNYDVQGELIGRTETDRDGAWSMDIPGTVYEYYNIMEWNLRGYLSDRAESLDGTVRNADWIQYAYPLSEKRFYGNKFWDYRLVPPTATRTYTPSPAPQTATRTYTPSPALPTATRTYTPSPALQTATRTYTPSPALQTATRTYTPSPAMTPSKTPPSPITYAICASADTFVKKSQPTLNFGHVPMLDLGYMTEGNLEITRRGFLRFDLTSIPPGSEIISAYIGLGMYDVYGLSPVSLGLHAVRERWDEYAITWDAQPAFNGSPFVQTSVNNVIPQLITWDVSELAEQWFLNPRSNFGVAIVGPEAGAAWARVFESREGGRCPELVLNLIPSGPIPTSTVTPTPTRTPTPTSPCIAADEAGNTPGLATNLTLFADKIGYICPSGDQDWYKFPAQNLNEIVVHLPNPPYDYDLTLLNSDGYGAAWSSNSGPASEFIRYYADRSGSWKVGVQGKTVADWHKSKPYTLRVDVCGGPDDPLNPGAGDSINWPAQLANGTTHSGWLCPQGDEDWYEFTVPPGQAQISAKLSNLPKNYMMALYDPSGMARTTSQQNGPPEETISFLANNQPGKWRVVVRGLPQSNPAWDAVNPYTLRVDVPPLPDFRVLGVEIVQVTQNTQGTIPLIAAKTTMARVYLDIGAAQGPIPNVSVELRGWKGVSSLGSLVRTGTVSKFTLANARLDLSRSINFILPNSWRGAGTLYLTAHVNLGDVLPETDYANNEGSRQGTFYTANTTNVWLVSVQASNLTPAANDPDLVASIAFLEAIFPIPYAQIWGVPNYVLSANYNYVTNGVKCVNGWSNLLDDLQDLYDGWKNRPPNSVIYGYMDQLVNSPDVGGCGRTGVAAGILGTNSNTTLAHETGHAYSLAHAPCGNPSGVDPSWPTGTNPGAIIGEVGVRPGAGTGGQLFDPNSAFDLMSYCGPQWFSPYNYKYLIKKIAPTAPSSAAAAALRAEHRAGDQTYLIVAGRQVDDGSLSLRPFWTDTFAPGQYDDDGQGPYAIELRDGEGQALFVRRFDPQGSLQGPDHEAGYFHEIMPYPGGVRRIVIRHDDRIVSQVPVSAHPPSVRLLSPGGGELWEGAGPFPVEWEMSDEDDDLLTAHVLYSRDGGESWLPVAVNLREGLALLDGRGLGGSQQARLRVRVTDGVNTAETDSEIFRVSRKDPLALITQPRAATVYLPGEPILIRGLGNDPEDGSLADGALAWMSDVNGYLGEGREILVDWLVPGEHTITLTARDSDEQAGQAHVRIFVGLPLQLPLVLRAK